MGPTSFKNGFNTKESKIQPYNNGSMVLLPINKVYIQDPDATEPGQIYITLQSWKNFQDKVASDRGAISYAESKGFASGKDKLADIPTLLQYEKTIWSDGFNGAGIESIFGSDGIQAIKDVVGTDFIDKIEAFARST